MIVVKKRVRTMVELMDLSLAFDFFGQAGMLKWK